MNNSKRGKKKIKDKKEAKRKRGYSSRKMEITKRNKKLAFKQ